MKHLILTFCIIFTVISSSEGRGRTDAIWKEIDGVSVPVPPAEHPRLYVRAYEIPELKEKMKTPDGRKILAALEEAAVDRTPEEEAKEKDRGFRYYFKMRGLTSRVQLQALDYLVDGDRTQARRAIVSMLDSLKRTSFGTRQDLSRASGVMLMTGAMVYDWCYDQMTDAEKQAYIKEFIRIAGTMECHYPPKNTEPIAGHSSEWMILRDMLSAGIAIYDEYPDMYNYVVTMMFRDYIPARNFIYSGHNYHQGTGYVSVRFVNDLISLFILDKMGAGAVYDPAQQFVLYDFIYRRRPDGQVLPAGDVNPGNRKTPNSYAMPAMFAASYYNDGYIANEYFRRPSVEPHLLMMELLWRDFDLEPKSPDDLPLTRYSGTPFGWMIARTGWDKDCVIAEMKVNENFVGNHQHLDAGSFQIYYKGPLAIDSGAYQGSSGGYNSPHCKNYFKRTVAHNSLLIYDPQEKFACWNYGGGDKTEFAANDGGQRMPGDRWDTCRSFKSLLSDDYTVGNVLAHSFGPDLDVPEYSYLKGDITSAYSDKVKDVRRSFVFLNLKDSTVPASLVIYDHVVSSDPGFRKFWLLHSIEEPSVDGTEFTVSRTMDGDSGMLKNTVLLPEKDNVSITAVGGPGKEFWVFGTNYPNAATSRPDPANERGEWRVEVVPVNPSAEDCFLNVIQVADNSCRSFNDVRRIDGDKVAGAMISDRVVIFGRDGQALDKRVGFEIPDSEKEFRILVTDLVPGVWKVIKDGKVLIPAAEVRADDGTLYFSGQSGHYTLYMK
ncbi:MAG: heparinase II/III family protein [Bacteroidales bacterium]|nr:heparinase II/III family protein [Bacteroidales bacterium]